MPVPTVITDLSTTAGSNSPAGTESIGTNADDYIRSHAAFIAALRDGSKNLALGSAGAPSQAFTGDSNTGIYSPGADQLAISAGSAQVMVATSTGVAFPLPVTLASGGSGHAATIGNDVTIYDINQADYMGLRGVVDSNRAGIQFGSAGAIVSGSAGAIVCSTVIKGNGGGSGLGAITISTSAPSGGASGDLWIKY